MSKRNKQRRLYPDSLLQKSPILIGLCFWGGEPKRIAAAKQLAQLLVRHHLGFCDLTKFGVPRGAIQAICTLAAKTPAPEFKSTPILIPTRHGKNRWATLEDRNLAGGAQ